MKTFIRLIRRYVITAVCIVLALLLLLFGLLVWYGWQSARYLPMHEYTPVKIADALVFTPNGFAFSDERTPSEWMNGYEWAMVLDSDGNVIWDYALPDRLNHRYTSCEIASFSRWYLDDYPVFCWVEDYGLFVIALPKGELWKYNLYASPNVITDLASSILPVFFGLLFLGLAICFLFSWRSAKRLKTVAAGLDALADGQTVSLPVGGFTAELAEKLNQTSSHLQTKNEIIARRDQARTQWIAGVSHDVRTPLALILGWAEQIEQDASLPAAARQKASGIRTQSERLRALIDDLNLTSKLQYDAAPLRKEIFSAGPLIRELTAQFCDSPLAERCELSLQQTDAAEHARLFVDRALLGRLLENLLNNSVRHNETPVKIVICTDVIGDKLQLSVADNGAGYPAAVLAALYAPDCSYDAPPHILGLHVAEQIAAAHGGQIVFGQNNPSGAKTTVWLPLGS